MNVNITDKINRVVSCIHDSPSDKLLEEAQVVSDAVQQNIYENAHVALDQKAHQKKYDDLTARYETLKTRIEDLNEQISQTQSQKGSVEDFLAALEKLPETLTAFSLDNFNALTDYLRNCAKITCAVCSGFFFAGKEENVAIPRYGEAF